MTRLTRFTAAGLGALLVVTAGGVALAAPRPSDATHHAPAATSAHRISRDAFHDQMRKLWEDHITWTRLYIVSAATLPDNLPDIGPTADRLFANQDEIGAAVGAFFGQRAGDRLATLLREHIALAAQAVTAAKAGNDAGLQSALDDWYANANQVARFLHNLNPDFWPLHEMRMHMRMHLDLTLEEAVARLHGDFKADIAAYDQVHLQILEMADLLSDGIIHRFPGRFGR
jgi:hypothetical protein